jgi:hypothetical protein
MAEKEKKMIRIEIRNEERIHGVTLLDKLRAMNFSSFEGEIKHHYDPANMTTIFYCYPEPRDVLLKDFSSIRNQLTKGGSL